MNKYVKFFLILIFYNILHFGFDLVKFPALKPICGINESLWQHSKMGFFSLLLVNIIELVYNIIKKEKITNVYVYSRIFANVILPYIMILTWYFILCQGASIC